MSRTKTARSRRSLPAILAALLMLLGIPAVTTVVTATPAMASITDTRADAWGTLELAGANWMNGAGVDIYSNGPAAFYVPDKPSNTVTTPSGSNVTSGEKWQCVELVNRLYLSKGWTSARWTGNGGQMYDTAPSGLAKELNGSIANLKPGDVVVLQDGGAGHAGIINSIDGSAVSIVNQNTKAVYSSATLSGGTLTMSGWSSYSVKGVVHAPSTPGGGGTTPPPDADGDNVSDADDWCPIVAGSSVNKGCPNDITQISGDVDGDSKDDVIYVSRGTDNAPGLGWFKSTSGATPSIADATSAGVSLPAPAWNVYHLKWTVGDFNGDGKDDLFVMSGSPVDPPAMYMLSSNGNGFNSPVLVKQPNPAYWIWERLQLKAADVDGDGKDDILAISRGTDNAPGLSWLRSTSTATAPSLADPVSAGVSLPAPAWNVYHLKWTVGDFNGDGKDDLFVMSGSQSDPPAMYILGSTGSGLAAPTLVKQPNPAYWQWTRLQVMAADKDGDGKDDVIYVSRGTNNEAAIGWLRSTSSGTTMSLADGIGLSTPGSGWLVPNLKWAITDVDGDGKDDLFACSGSQSDPPSLYVFKATATGLDNPALVKQPNPAYWIWERLQF